MGVGFRFGGNEKKGLYGSLRKRDWSSRDCSECPQKDRPKERLGKRVGGTRGECRETKSLYDTEEVRWTLKRVRQGKCSVREGEGETVQ